MGFGEVVIEESLVFSNEGRCMVVVSGVKGFYFFRRLEKYIYVVFWLSVFWGVEVMWLEVF